MNLQSLFVFGIGFPLFYRQTIAGKTDYCASDKSQFDTQKLERHLKKLRDFYNVNFTTPNDVGEIVQLYKSQQFQTGFEDKKTQKMVKKIIHLRECNCDREVLVNDEKVDFEKEFHFSTCSEHAFLRGSNQKVVSFVFYGDPNARRYFDGIYQNYRAIDEFYGKKLHHFVMRLYHDLDPNSVQFANLCQIACKNPNLDLCHAKNIPGTHTLRSLACKNFIPNFSLLQH